MSKYFLIVEGKTPTTHHTEKELIDTIIKAREGVLNKPKAMYCKFSPCDYIQNFKNCTFKKI